VYSLRWITRFAIPLLNEIGIEPFLNLSHRRRWFRTSTPPSLAEKSNDPYLIALVAGSAANGKQAADIKKLLEKLANLQAVDGHLDGKEGSITRSGGISLAVETTSLPVLAWMKVPAFRPQAEKAVQWLVGSRLGGEQCREPAA